MTYPQCPHIKSSPPVPDILLSVRRIERFSVVIGPTGIMSIVAISSPNIRQLRGHRSSKIRADQPDPAKCLIFASGDMWLRDRETPKNGGLQGVANALRAGSLVPINFPEKLPLSAPC